MGQLFTGSQFTPTAGCVKHPSKGHMLKQLENCRLFANRKWAHTVEATCRNLWNQRRMWCAHTLKPSCSAKPVVPLNFICRYDVWDMQAGISGQLCCRLSDQPLSWPLSTSCNVNKSNSTRRCNSAGLCPRANLVAMPWCLLVSSWRWEEGGPIGRLAWGVEVRMASGT